FSTPRRPDSPPRPRTRALALYDPFADRRVFPAGVRYCLNVYAGCSHACRYCYVSNYVPRTRRGRVKQGFPRQIQRDLRAIEALGLPRAPLHVSNSTDPLQWRLETERRHTLQALRMIAASRGLFSTVTVLTKNPLLLAAPEYLDVLHSLYPCTVQVSLAFWDDQRRRALEPGAPSVRQRLNGIRALVKAAVRVEVRLDPLFPREPLPKPFFVSPRLSDYGAPVAHTWGDLRRLVDFAVETGCSRVVSSPLKVPCGRHASRAFMRAMQPLYRDAAGGKSYVRGFCLRLPDAYVRDHLLGPLRQYCQGLGIEFQTCKENLVRNK
ncbi:MAG: radical SAM protein, partial [Armatimonadota bacterium]